MAAIGLAWKAQRGELTLLIGSVVALSVVALVLPSTNLAVADARAIVLLLTLAAPVGMGSLLGAGLMTDELERGTARISWPLAIARWRWLWLRTWPVAVLGVVATLALGTASGRLMDLTTPSNIFMPQMRGPIVAVHFLATLAIGLLVGSVVRRGLPAVLLSLVLGTIVFVSVTLASEPWMREHAVLMPMEEHRDEPILAVLEHDRAVRAADGTLVVRDPVCISPSECDAALASMTPVVLAVPGDAYLMILAVETLAAGTVVLLASGATVGVITRWGPG